VTVVQYSITIYVNHHIYVVMALCGRNISLNLHESMDYLGEILLKIVLCVYIYIYIYIYTPAVQRLTARVETQRRSLLSNFCSIANKEYPVLFQSVEIAHMSPTIRARFPCRANQSQPLYS
jgi:hypothetical protein